MTAHSGVGLSPQLSKTKPLVDSSLNPNKINKLPESAKSGLPMNYLEKIQNQLKPGEKGDADEEEVPYK